MSADTPFEFEIELFDVDDCPPAQAIHWALSDHNLAEFGPPNRQPLVLSISDPDGKLVAGLRGSSHWNWLYITHLWVAPTHRKLHLGRHLMARAEDEARQRGCIGGYVDTFSPEALRFYQSLGYVLFGQLDQFPPGHQRYFLWKRLEG